MGEPAPEGDGGPRPALEDRLAAAELELAAMRRHLASIVDATGSIVWVADTERGFVEPQPSWARYTGQTPAEYGGFGYMDAIHPDDRKALGAVNRAAAGGETVWEAKGRVWHAASGAYRHCVSRGAPLRDDSGAVIGWIGVCTDVHEQVAAREEAEAISAAAQRAQRAAEAAQREAEEAAAAAEAANRRLRQLQEISDVAVSRLPLADLVDALRHRLRSVLAVDTVRILLLDERTKRLRSAAPDPDDPAGPEFSLPVGRGFGGRVALAGGPVIEPDAGSIERLDPLIAGARSLAGVPLLVGDRLVGVLHVGTEERRVFTRADVELLELGAERIAAAMERSRAFERERTLARTLQAALLPPSLPAVPGMSLSARYIAAGEGLDVGGDFYDVFPVGDAWLAVIGDVCGRGPEAAAMTGLARHTVRAVAGENFGPAEVLSRLNSALAAEAGDERFATALCARLEPDPADGRARLVLASGGHCRPIVLRRDGTAEPVAVGGVILGPFPDVKLEEVTVEIAAGDSLVLYTDGVVEAQGIGGFFGELRLLSVLRSAAGRTSAELAGLVEEAVKGHAGGPPDDDLALMVVQVPPPLPPTPEVLVDVALPAGDLAAGHGRRAAARALRARALAEDVVDAVRLIVSELVTNAIRYGRPDVAGPRLRLLAGESAVRVEVRNRGRAFALPTERAALLDESGRGLAVVRHLALAVGVDDEGATVSVWAVVGTAVP